jgi:uncharacterized protein (UPF0332 family)
MKPESGRIPAKARKTLDDGKAVLAIQLWELAAREAYMAAFTAARAYLYETAGATPKTHAGVRLLFGKAVQSDPALGRDLAQFLTTAYEFKDTADYSTMRTVAEADARRAMTEAESFVGKIASILARSKESQA